MPRHADTDDLDDSNDDGDVEMIPCPYCGKQIYEDAERCPECGQYVSREDSSPAKPLWIVVGAVACLFVVYLWITR